MTAGLERRRLTVFFRLILAIPHLIWLALWGIGAVVLAVVNWFAVLFTGRAPDGLHRFLAAYVNYNVHVYAYLDLAAERYPGFTGDPGYEVDVELPPPAEQRRWTVALRLFLALPALLLVVAIAGSGGGPPTWPDTGDETSYSLEFVGLLTAGGIVAWFYSLFKARAPEGVTRLLWFALHYGAQAWSYIFVLTDRYPRADPTVLGVPRRPPPHPVALTVPRDELERSRLTVFFRLLLAVPHFVWLALWAIAAFVVVVLSWLATLASGRSPEAFHRFLGAFLRYSTHVGAFVTLMANPFPGFAGAPGSYPVDLDIAPREPQHRAVTAFRIVLAIPAIVIQSALNTVLYVAAFLGWWAALFTGRMPRDLRNLGVWAIRYAAQLDAYLLLLTDRYPYAGPPADAASVPGAADAGVPPAAPGAPDGPAPAPADPRFPEDDPRGAWKPSPFQPPESGG